LGKIEIYDLDTLIYRGCFAAEKKNYVAASPDTYLTFSSKKDYNVWSKGISRPDHELWIEHKVEPIENAIHIIKQIIDSCHEKIQGLEQRFFLSGKGNFRYKIATVAPYKGNRDPSHKPVHLEGVREWALKYLAAEVVDGAEADDGVAILATSNPESVIVSNDKDFKQIPGWHYNFVTGEMFNVTEREAGLYFFQQLLTGDPTDNIPGIEGLGEVGASKILAGCSGVREAEIRVLQAYRDKYGADEGWKRFIETGRLVRIHTSRDEINKLWEPKYVTREGQL
jgi:hypothetical protein